MTERKRNLLFLSVMLVVLILFFSKILFTTKIIRAPDIINEFYWGVKGMADWPLWNLFKVDVSHASWNPFVNSGYTNEGGDASSQFLFLQHFVFHFIPAPANVAWYIVMHFFIAASGVYCYCRLIGATPLAAFLGGLIFVLAPENTSLINAGHVMKIATISFAPWAFYFFEKGFLTRRLIFFMATAFILAVQFFHTHWQIAFYTCLGMALYALIRLSGIYLEKGTENRRDFLRLFGLNLVVLFFFLSTVAISLAPLANWSRETNRGGNSGANSSAPGAPAGGPQAKGGLDREEAMAWSLPPEELAAFVVPGLFGFSRQEAGENPANISSYYWGRMRFTQTVSYMGLLPWLLLPLPLIFRRDRYTWIAVAAVAVGILFSMGKYTLFYNLLFDYFPGINRFRVPKMIMFMPVLGLGVLAARGMDLLADETLRGTVAFRRYMLGLLTLPVVLLALLGVELLGKNYWLTSFGEILSQPTRYEQGPQLAMQRWNNLAMETGIAAGLSALCAAAFSAWYWKRLSIRLLPFVLLALFLCDVGRVNSKFLFLVDEPHKTGKGGATSPEITYLRANSSKLYRVLPFDGSDPLQYSTAGIPVMFTSNPVQQMRWQQFLDAFNVAGPMPDMMNVKYLIVADQDYQKQKAQLGARFAPVFIPPGGAAVILENKNVLPKGWLVPAAALMPDPAQRLAVLQNPQFNPALVALVESLPPIPLADPNVSQTPFPPQSVSVPVYEDQRIVVEAKPDRNGLLVLGEKYYKGWRATVDGTAAEIVPVDHVLRGVYLTPGNHRVEFRFDPLPYKVGKYLTLGSFLLFGIMLVREWVVRRRGQELARKG